MQGDGGSPLVCSMPDGRYELAGLVSWGLDCASANVPDVYTNVAAMRAWIDEKLAETN